MADDEKGTWLGEFELGRQHEQVGPELGRLDEARDVRTGEPALLLRPGKGVKWQLEEGWRVSLSSHRHPSGVVMVVHHAPPSGRTTKLADVLVLSTAALERVEDDERMDQHLTSGRSSAPAPEVKRGFGRRWAWGLTTAALSLLSLGVGFWLRGVGPGGSAQAEAARMTDGQAGVTNPIAYPMPKLPSPDQAAAPCSLKLREVTINGGCWMTLEQRPPCVEETQAEHQGKCYFPVPKRKEMRPGQSDNP